jgi:2-phosphosulfolactate phosphatase
MRRTVAIRCHPDGMERVAERGAVVAVDVIRATTTAVTAVAMGRRCYPVPNVTVALRAASAIPDALLVGELGGAMPEGFHMTNSPAEIALHDDRRPVILLSSSGTPLIDRVRYHDAAYVACFRNTAPTVLQLLRHGLPVTVIGAGTRGEFREEDQMCCAWIAAGLIDDGYLPEDRETEEMARKWKFASPLDFMGSRSVAYLKRSNQMRDLDFILDHFGDLDCAFRIDGDQIVRVPSPESHFVAV